jgi:transposase
LALVVLSVVEQRLDAVRAVLDGADVVEVAARVGVHRATVHRWVARYLTGQLAGLADRSHRPRSSPRQAAEAVEVAVAEMRREHPRWGSRRIRLEMLRSSRGLFAKTRCPCGVKFSYPSMPSTWRTAGREINALVRGRGSAFR